MRKIIQSINITPDGFCDHTAVIADDELHEFYNEMVKQMDTMIFGRVTYDLMKNAWPTIAKERTAPKAMVEFADLIDNINKIVFSRTLKKSDWNNTTIIPEINRDEILRLKEGEGKDILVGGINVMDQFSQMGLIDEYYFQVHPIIEGKGVRFFNTLELSKRINLNLIDIKTFKSGVVSLKYIVKRDE